MPRWVKNFLYKIYNRIHYPDMKGKKCHFGDENKDFIVYIIRPRTDGVEGLMALFLHVMKLQSYSDKKGYLSFVDMKNYKTQYFENNENSWDYFFESKNNLTIDSAYNSKNVILSDINTFYNAPKYLDMSFKENDLLKTKELFDKNYKFSKEVLELVNKENENIHVEDCIGLYLRGTDYLKMRPAGHPVQPTVEQAIEVVENYLAKYGNHKIFLVTEDYEIYKELIHKYNNLIVVVSFDSFIHDYKSDKFISKGYTNQLNSYVKQNGLNYMAKLILLSKCKYFIGGKTCGSWASNVFSDGFESKYIFELGLY